MQGKRFCAALPFLILAGCVSAPTQQQAYEAYYGEPISQDDAEAAVKQAAGAFLRDPMSAVYVCKIGGKGYIASGMAFGGRDAYGWTLSCNINAKNAYGAYAGEQHYGFIFRDGQLRRGAIFSGSAMQVVYDNP